MACAGSLDMHAFSSETGVLKEPCWFIGFSSLYYDTLDGSATPPHVEMFSLLPALVGLGICWCVYFMRFVGAPGASYRK